MYERLYGAGLVKPESSSTHSFCVKNKNKTICALQLKDVASWCGLVNTRILHLWFCFLVLPMYVCMYVCMYREQLVHTNPENEYKLEHKKTKTKTKKSAEQHCKTQTRTWSPPGPSRAWSPAVLALDGLSGGPTVKKPSCGLKFERHAIIPNLKSIGITKGQKEEKVYAMLCGQRKKVKKKKNNNKIKIKIKNSSIRSGNRLPGTVNVGESRSESQTGG